MGKIEQEVLYGMSKEQLLAAMSAHRARVEKLVTQNAPHDVKNRERQRIHNMVNVLYDKWGAVYGSDKEYSTPSGLTFNRLATSLNDRTS